MSSIIEQAIQLEQAAQANYLEGAEATTDSSAAAILRLLADEEAEHAKVLRGLADVAALGDPDLITKGRAWIRGNIEGGIDSVSSDLGVLDALRRAMDLEQRTEAFYQEQAEVAGDAEVSTLFRRLAEMENGHYVFVSSLIEYYNRPQEWIEQAEFGFRDAY